MQAPHEKNDTTVRDSTTYKDWSNPQKQRRGLRRLRHALGYSVDGLSAALRESAFRQELVLLIAGLPLALWIGQGWVERSMLIATLVLILVVELLNTGIEAAIDRFGPVRHPLAKKAKDTGSAAVLLSLLLAAGVWLSALVHCIRS